MSLHINDKHIHFIQHDLKLRGLTSEELQADLLDHICCILENECRDEANFNTCYEKIISRFYVQELREIEKERNLLFTFKYIYLMQKTIYFSGIISSIAIAAGAVLRILSMPGANILLVSGIFLLTLIFLPFLFTIQWRKGSMFQEKLYTAVSFITAFLAITGILFKLMFWPFASTISFVSVGLILFLFVPMYLWKNYSKTSGDYSALLTSIFLIAGAGLLMSLSNRNVSKKTSQQLFSVYQRLEEANSNTRIFNVHLKKSAKIEKQEQEYIQECETLVQKIKELKFVLSPVRLSGSNNNYFNSIENWADKEAVQHLNQDQWKSLFSQINKINQLTNVLVAYPHHQSLLLTEIPEDPYNKTVGLVMNDLLMLEMKILANESRVLNYFQK